MDGGAPIRVESGRVEDERVLSVRAQKAARAADPLYAAHVKVQPKSVSGPVRSLKWRVLAVCLAIYYALPWLRWDRGPGAPDQAVLLDLDNRRAYFFFIEIWPQEVFYLTGILVLAALALFLATALLGRVWCGYACPQTVWTDLFMWIERRIEGDRNARIKLDKAPLTARKAGLKAAKHAAWLAVAFATGGAWIMYFVDAPTIAADFFAGRASATAYFFVGLFTATTYLLAGWAREQVCTYMCPWPRFQSAMFDEDSLIVTYRGWRGEPRGKLAKDGIAPGKGDCIDCGQCVAVCPTGIDIRDGNQLECIGCGLCVDACNGVMAKIGRPPDLIAWDTERRQAQRARGEAPTYRLVRPRTVLYALLFLGVALAMLVSLALRDDAAINVLHDRNPLFVTLADGSVRNGYTVKILNKERARRQFALSAPGLPPAATLTIVGGERDQRQVLVEAAPDQVTTVQIYIRLPAEALARPRIDFDLVVVDVHGGARAARSTRFYGPEK
jgi:cytochrome c oxidase accessory protein FixG